MRRHPLTVGNWARRMDDCHPDEAMVKLISVEYVGAGGDFEVWTVRSQGGKEVRLLSGYLEAVQSAYAP